MSPDLPPPCAEPRRPGRLAVFLARPIATVLYSGYAPIAPGTAGSAVTALAYYYLGGSLGTLSWVVLLAAVISLSIMVSDIMSREWGKDPGRVVADETAGYLVTVAFLPHGVWTAVAGFVVFRILDVVKPTPARQLESVRGGWGIVADDVAAGVYGNLILRAGMWLVPVLGSGT